MTDGLGRYAFLSLDILVCTLALEMDGWMGGYVRKGCPRVRFRPGTESGLCRTQLFRGYRNLGMDSVTTREIYCTW